VKPVLRDWVRRHEIDQGMRDGIGSDEREVEAPHRANASKFKTITIGNLAIKPLRRDDLNNWCATSRKADQEPAYAPLAGRPGNQNHSRRSRLPRRAQLQRHPAVRACQGAAAHSYALLDQGRLKCFGQRFQAVF
jgi:hypothetical protein